MIRAQIDILRLEASIQDRVRNILLDFESELKVALVKIDPTAVTMGHAQRARLEKLIEEAQVLISTSYSSVRSELLSGLRDVATLSTDQVSRMVNQSVGVDIAHGIADAATLAELSKDTLIEGASSKEWWSRQSQNTSDRFAREMRKGMSLSETISQLATRIMGRPAKAGSFAIAGLNDLMLRQAESLVRTSVMAVSNTVRLSTYDANSDIISGIQWLSTLDNRTTIVCINLDGKRWDNDRNPIGHSITFPGPTAHWGCRSTQTPILKSWAELIKDPVLAKKLDALENSSTRASMGGYVSGKTTYESWLKSLPESQQIEILGKGRYKLLQSGSISFSDLVDQRGHPRTLKELMDN